MFWKDWTSLHKPWLYVFGGEGRLEERRIGETGGQFSYWVILNHYSKRWNSIWHHSSVVTKMLFKPSLFPLRWSAAFLPQDVFLYKAASFRGGKCSDLPSQLSLLYEFQNTSMNIISFHLHRYIYVYEVMEITQSHTINGEAGTWT